jgi:hypothetical protein
MGLLVIVRFGLGSGFKVRLDILYSMFRVRFWVRVGV